MATKDRTALKDEFKNGNLATGERFADLIDSMKVVQEPVEDPAASGTSLSFIASIEQNADGKITAMKKTLDLENAHELNPFKGWYKTGDTLPTDGFDGAYLYFKDTSELTGQTTIYRWNGTTYADTGTVVDTSNVQTFETGQAVNGVAIDGTGLANPLPNAIAKAEDAAKLKRKLDGIGYDEDRVMPVTSGSGQNVYNGFIETKGTGENHFKSSTSTPPTKLIIDSISGYDKVRFLGRKTNATNVTSGYLFLNLTGVDDVESLMDNGDDWSDYIVEKYSWEIVSSQFGTVEIEKAVPAGATHFATAYGGTAIPEADFYLYNCKGNPDQTVSSYVREKIAEIDVEQDVDYNTTLVGRGVESPSNGLVKVEIPVTPGVTYRVVLSNPNIDMSELSGLSSGYQVLRLRGRIAPGDANTIGYVDVLVGETLNKEYTVTIQDGYPILLIIMRANSGAEQTFTIYPIAESESVAVNCIVLRNGKMGNDGVVNDDTKRLVTSPIPLDNGMYIGLRDAYKIKAVHIVDENGEMVNFYEIPDTSTYPTCYPFATNDFSFYSNAVCMPQYKAVVEIVRRDGGDILPTERAIRELAYMNDSRIKRRIPTGSWYKGFYQRVLLMQKAMWKPIEKVIAATYQTENFNNIYFLAGGTFVGLPYSEASEYSKYIGQHVSVRTFLTALMEKHSVMYTEHINGSDAWAAGKAEPNVSKYGISYANGLTAHYAATYYGSVCTGFTGYCLGLPVIVVSSDYDTYPSMIGLSLVAIPNGGKPSETVEVGDIIWYNGHCSIVTDIYCDDYGDVKYIVWAEQTRPTARMTVYSADDFDVRFITKESKIYRKDMSVADYTDTYNDKAVVNTSLFEFPVDVEIDPDISTFAGDYAAFSIGDYTETLNNNKAYLICHRGAGYSQVVIEEEDDSTNTHTIDISSNVSGSVEQLDIYETDAANEEDWVRVNIAPLFSNETLQPGKYKAKLVGANNVESGYTHFEMVDISLSLAKTANGITATFASANGTPYLLKQEKASGITNRAEVGNGSYVPYKDISEETSPVELAGWAYDSDHKYIKLYVQGEYGVVARREEIPQ